MTFTTTPFWVFLACTLPLIYATKGKLRKVVLLAASYVFYGSWDVRFLGLLWLSTLVDYVVGLGTERAPNQAARKRWLLLSLVFNLGLLSYFKYGGFFLESFAALCSKLGLQAVIPSLHIVLPVGISFYTFQSLSYTIDVYNRRIQATRSLFDYAVYVAFFPQLVAGPIERAGFFLPQVINNPKPRAPSIESVGLIAFGCAKKILGDYFGEIVDPIYEDVAGARPLALWVGTYAFAMQIYLDFSGYTDIAVGIGKLLGYNMPDNFKAPYAATSPSDFWRRWHISLSTWLRDYLYIPLGGNRHGTARTGRNLMITMALGGLWHGAAWNYILWGIYHGGLLVAERLPLFQAERWSFTGRFGLLAKRLFCFHLICLGWMLFRARSLSDCAIAMRKLLNPFEFEIGAFVNAVVHAQDGKRLSFYALVTALLVAVHHAYPETTKAFVARMRTLPPAVAYAVCAILLYGAALASPRSSGTFIYFQF